MRLSEDQWLSVMFWAGRALTVLGLGLIVASLVGVFG